MLLHLHAVVLKLHMTFLLLITFFGDIKKQIRFILNTNQKLQNRIQTKINAITGRIISKLVGGFYNNLGLCQALEDQFEYL